MRICIYGISNVQKLAITIKGKMPPSKKNSKQIFTNRKTGRPFITSSVKYKDWETQMLWRLKGTAKIHDIEEVELEFYPPNRVKADLTNKAESIMDMFVKAGVLEDDNWFDVPSIYLKFGGIDKANPRVEISIYHADSNEDAVDAVFNNKS